jgi:YbbR domain-containing protein
MRPKVLGSAFSVTVICGFFAHILYLIVDAIKMLAVQKDSHDPNP